jgi:hypothetical protein
LASRERNTMYRRSLPNEYCYRGFELRPKTLSSSAMGSVAANRSSRIRSYAPFIWRKSWPPMLDRVAHAQPLPSHRFGQVAQHIALRSDLDCIPRPSPRSGLLLPGPLISSSNSLQLPFVSNLTQISCIITAATAAKEAARSFRSLVQIPPSAAVHSICQSARDYFRSRQCSQLAWLPSSPHSSAPCMLSPCTHG